MMTKTPYVGLRPFERDEHEFFFGREQCVDELLDLLPQRTFLAVIGEAYCGKTSLVRGGLEARLLQNNTTDSIIQWHIANFHPNSTPFFQVVDSLLKPEALGDILLEDFESYTIARRFLRQSLTQGSLSLHNLLEQKPLPKNHKLLMVCDQFEEVFHIWQKDKKRAREFVNFLIDSSRAHPFKSAVSTDIYVIITMRSAYLDKVPFFPKLEEAVRHNIYLTPRLNKEQLKQAIIQPAEVFRHGKNDGQAQKTEEPKNNPPPETAKENGPADAEEAVNQFYENIVAESTTANVQSDGKARDLEKRKKDEKNVPEPENIVSAKLAQHLLETLDSHSDQLPLLQHLLKRMWDICAVNPEEMHLNMELLKKGRIESFQQALPLHLEEAHTALKDEKNKVIAEALFRKLIAVKDDSRPRLLYRPVKLGDIVELTGSSIEEVTKVIEVFRTKERRFLKPNLPAELKADSNIEIAHESIARHWPRLKEWKSKEIREEANYILLDSLAHKHHEEEGGFLKPPELHELWDWYKQDGFDDNWAQHYGCNAKMSKAYLLKSKARHSSGKYVKMAAGATVLIGIFYLLLSLGSMGASSSEETLEIFYAMREELITPKNSRQLEQQFKRWTKDKPNNINAWLYYGLSQSYQQKWDEAEKTFRNGLNVEPDNSKLLFHLAKALNEKPQKQPDEAIRLLNGILAKKPDDTAVLQLLGDILSQQDKLKEAKNRQKQQLQQAVEYFKKALESDPENPVIMSKLAKDLSLLGRNQEALEYLKKAVELDKENAAYWKQLGLELMESGQIKQAIEAFDNALAKKPGDDENSRNLGRAYFYDGKMKQAEEAFRNAIGLNPDSDLNHRYRGDALMRLGRLEDALKSYNNAEKIKPTRTTLMQKSKLFSRLGNLEKAQEFHDKALSIIEEDTWE